VLRSGLALNSQVINDVVYRQVARLSAPPPDMMTALRTAVLRLTFESWSARNRESINAFVRRVPRAPELADAARLAFWISPIASISAALVAAPMGLGHSPLSEVGLMAVWAGISGYLARKYFSWYHGLLEVPRFYMFLIPTMVFIVPEISKDIDARLPKFSSFADVPERIVHLVTDLLETIVHLPSATLYMTAWTAAVALYAFFWPIGSTSAVRLGECLRPPYWPLIPLQVLLRGVRSVIAAFRWRRTWVVNLLSIIFAGFFLWIVAIYPVTLLATLAAGFPFGLWLIWLNKHRFKQFTRGVTGNELGRIYHLERTECGRAALLERVQSCGVVEKDEASVGGIQHLAFHIDARLAGGPMRPPRSTAQRLFRRFWHRVAAGLDSVDWSLDERYLRSQRDSVYLILEAHRRSTLTDYAAAANRQFNNAIEGAGPNSLERQEFSLPPGLFVAY
jgi:hypothetical protein